MLCYSMYTALAPSVVAAVAVDGGKMQVQYHQSTGSSKLDEERRINGAHSIYHLALQSVRLDSRCQVYRLALLHYTTPCPVTAGTMSRPAAASPNLRTILHLLTFSIPRILSSHLSLVHLPSWKRFTATAVVVTDSSSSSEAAAAAVAVVTAVE